MNYIKAMESVMQGLKFFNFHPSKKSKVIE